MVVARTVAALVADDHVAQRHDRETVGNVVGLGVAA
jgi:hypothetical protein